MKGSNISKRVCWAKKAPFKIQRHTHTAVISTAATENFEAIWTRFRHGTLKKQYFLRWKVFEKIERKALSKKGTFQKRHSLRKGRFLEKGHFSGKGHFFKKGTFSKRAIMEKITLPPKCPKRSKFAWNHHF